MSINLQSFREFKKFFKSQKRNHHALYVLQKKNDPNTIDYIQNPHFPVPKNTKFFLTQVYQKDMGELHKLVKSSQLGYGELPIVIMIHKDSNIFKVIKDPTPQNIHKHLKTFTAPSKYKNKSIAELQKMLNDTSALRPSPLGSQWEIAKKMEDTDNLHCLKDIIHNKKSVVLFKSDNCGYCHNFWPTFHRMSKALHPTPFYYVDYGQHKNTIKVILEDFNEVHGFPSGLKNITGVPTIAYFNGPMYPKLLANYEGGRDFNKLKKEIEEAIKNVFVNIRKHEERLDADKLIKQANENNAVVLFINWRHEPCLKAAGKLKKALELIEKKTDAGAKTLNVYVFNVRNHLNMWESIRSKFKQAFKTVVDIHSLPQIVYFFKEKYDKIPSFQQNIEQYKAEDLADTLVRQFPLDLKLKSDLTSEIDFLLKEEKDDVIDLEPTMFSGGATSMIRKLNAIEGKLDTILNALDLV